MTPRVAAREGAVVPPAPGSTPRDDAPVLEGQGLTVGYVGRRGRARPVLAGLELSLRAGRMTCVLGANGTGKSTLLRTLAGMQPPLAGSVRLLGDVVGALPPSERARRLAVVLTERVDLGVLSGWELVALGRYPHTGWDGRLSDADRAVVRWAVEATASTAFAGRNVGELSDGERQRLLIARALAQEPAALLLDEPTAFVDVAGRVELFGLLRRLAGECGLAVLLTTHDLQLAVRAADDVWLVTGGRVSTGAPEDLVLDGSLAAAFPGPNVRFDPVDGGFTPVWPTRGAARVVGDGPAAVWAARALERAGWSTDPRPRARPDVGPRPRTRPDVGPEVVAVTAHDGPDGPRWTLDDGRGVSEHRRLEGLLARLGPPPGAG
ncbi:ABC transporter ATP-binding protein [soil metagenome]